MTTKNKRGRPAKNKGLDLFKLDKSLNINNINIYPAHKIKGIDNVYVEKTGALNKNIKAYMSCNKPTVFETMMECFKTKEKYITLIFTETGLLFVTQNTVNSPVKFECKIIPDNLNKYIINNVPDSKKEIKQVIKVDITLLHKVLKTIKKSSEFSFIVYHNTSINKDILRVENISSSCKKDYKDITVNGSLGYTLIQETLARPDLIVILESADFMTTIKNASAFHQNITIEYPGSHASLFKLVYDTNNMRGVTEYSEDTKDNKVNFVLKSDKIIHNTYDITAFIRYTKCSKFSTIVKLYIFNGSYMIIEYNVDPGLGTFQLYVNNINTLK